MKKKGNGYGKHTTIESSLFLSPAYLSLGHRGTSPVVSSCSAQVLILFYGKRQFGKVSKNKGYVRTDGNRLTLTYKELEARGFSQTRATRAFDELLAKGFIEIVHQGGCYDKDKTVYGLTDDYIFWRPGHQPVRVRVRDVKRGYQKKSKSRSSLKVVCQ